MAFPQTPISSCFYQNISRHTIVLLRSAPPPQSRSADQPAPPTAKYTSGHSPEGHGTFCIQWYHTASRASPHKPAHFSQCLQRRRHSVDNFAVIAVSCTNFYIRQGVQNIQFGNAQIGLPFTSALYRTTTLSNQTTRRGRPVVTPNSPPKEQIFTPISSTNLVGKGPSPTLVQ